MLSICLSVNINAQISGTVSNAQGEPLSFVNVYIEGTTSGTSTNSEGKYTIQNIDTNGRLVFQYIGYKNQYFDLANLSSSKNLDVVLAREEYQLKEVTVAANAEDPAYAIIRKAQAKRSYYKDKVNEYHCKVYVKGNQKILDAPKKIFGFDVGDMEGMLDSNRQGIVYLSESVSELYRKDNQTKEVMISSKVSGDDQGYSFNSAREMEIDFYEKSIELTRLMVSPIAPNAMGFYKYKFLGSYFTEEGFEINKIEVIPKDKHLPVFSGQIFIKEDSWNIYALDLTATKSGLDIPFIDSLNMIQTYVPGPEEDQWLKLSNVITFRLSGFGFDFRGTFGANYSDYDLSEIPDKFFNHEVYFVEDEANTRNETYWDSIRPIPLIAEELIDYSRKDSLQIVKESPEYKDSVDRAYNKFEWSDILSGFSRRNSEKRTRFEITSPISQLSYNTIQGLKLGMTVGWQKRKQENRSGNIYIRAHADYGFAEEKLRPRFEIGSWENSNTNFSWRLSGGIKTSQLNSKNPVEDIQNLYETLFERDNILKLYQEQFGQIRVSSYLNHWIRGSISAKYSRRSSLTNNADFSFFNRDESFTPNSLRYQFGWPEFFDPTNILLVETSLRFYPFMKTHRHPEYISRIRNRAYPVIRLNFKQAINSFSLSTDVNYTYAELSLNDDVLLGAYGNLSYHLAHGRFIGDFEGTHLDFAYFLGNESFDIQSKGTSRFLALPYYASSSNSFYQLNLEHDFQGLLFDRIPGFRNLGWQVVTGARFIFYEDFKDYREFSLGIDNIGFGNFKLFQIHAVWSTQGPFKNGFNIVFGIKSDL